MGIKFDTAQALFRAFHSREHFFSIWVFYQKRENDRNKKSKTTGPSCNFKRNPVQYSEIPLSLGHLHCLRSSLHFSIITHLASNGLKRPRVRFPISSRQHSLWLASLTLQPFVIWEISNHAEYLKWEHNNVQHSPINHNLYSSTPYTACVCIPFTSRIWPISLRLKTIPLDFSQKLGCYRLYINMYILLFNWGDFYKLCVCQ